MFGRKKQAAESAGRGRSKSLSVGSNKRKLDTKTASAPMLGSRGSSCLKGILKFTSVQESLSATYGKSSGGDDPAGENEDGASRRKGINLDKIEIREYERTLGDNPSCSSGPPIA